MFFFQAKKLKQQIDKHEIISFDIFDTLLIRPYIKPTDLFKHMEQIFQIADFANNRIEAEMLARSKYSKEKEEITFDEIYSEIPQKFKNFQQKEFEFEKQILQPHPQMFEIFEYAKNKKKKIIITSDMYLPKHFLEIILKEKGIVGWDKFYLSSEINKTKHTGNLYKYILEDFKIKPNKILHIGDNKHSDEKMAKKNGIKAFLIPKHFDVLLKKQPAYKNYYATDKNYKKSIILSMMAYNTKNHSYWYDLGWNYAAPAVLAYVQWIDKQGKQDDLDQLLFIARDGYILKKVFDKIASYKCVATYLFAPRFVKNNENVFCEYKKYLEKITFSKGKIAIVDSTTINFSSQTLLEYALNKKLLGYYWCTMPKSNHTSLDSKHFREFKSPTSPFLKIWDLMELFMTAPYPPIKDFKNGNIVFNTLNNHESIRIEVYEQIEKAILDYVDTYLKIFNKQKLFISENDISSLIDILPLYPTHQDKKYLSKIKHASDIYNTEFKPLISEWSTSKIKQFIFKKIKYNRTKKYKMFGLTIIKKSYKNNRCIFYFLGIPCFSFIKKNYKDK